jgi:hypothetical protein
VNGPRELEVSARRAQQAQKSPCEAAGAFLPLRRASLELAREAPKTAANHRHAAGSEKDEWRSRRCAILVSRGSRI